MTGHWTGPAPAKLYMVRHLLPALAPAACLLLPPTLVSPSALTLPAGNVLQDDKPTLCVPIAVPMLFLNSAVLGVACARYSNNMINGFRWFATFFVVALAVLFYEIALPW